jgi:hypothetical protein
MKNSEVVQVWFFLFVREVGKIDKKDEIIKMKYRKMNMHDGAWWFWFQWCWLKMKNNEDKGVTCSWSNSKIMHEKNAK